MPKGAKNIVRRPNSSLLTPDSSLYNYISFVPFGQSFWSFAFRALAMSTVVVHRAE